MPALLTQMSTGPSAGLGLSSAPSTSALELTSAWTATPPTSSAVAPRRSSSTSSTATRAPSRGKADADRLADARAAAGDDRDLAGRRSREHHRAPVDVAVPEPPVAVDRLVEARSRSTSISIAPARASATTSWSSGSDPQLGLLSDHSNGSVPNAIGSVPPPIPTRLMCPDIAIVAAARASVSSVPTKSKTTVAPRPRRPRGHPRPTALCRREPHPPRPRAPAAASARAGPPRRCAPERARAAAALRRDRDRLLR